MVENEIGIEPLNKCFPAGVLPGNETCESKGDLMKHHWWKIRRKLFPALFLVLPLLAAAGCISIKSDPIHITMDVNVKIDRELDNFFGDLDAKPAPAATAPAKEESK